MCNFVAAPNIAARDSNSRRKLNGCGHSWTQPLERRQIEYVVGDNLHLTPALVDHVEVVHGALQRDVHASDALWLDGVGECCHLAEVIPEQRRDANNALERVANLVARGRLAPANTAVAAFSSRASVAGGGRIIASTSCGCRCSIKGGITVVGCVNQTRS